MQPLITVSIPHWFDSTHKKLNLDLHNASVSIPHWFDSTILGAASATSIQLFQSHTGSIQRSSLLRLANRHDLVSIPHWFDSTDVYRRRLARARYVSIPHWFDSTHTSTTVVRDGPPSF